MAAAERRKLETKQQQQGGILGTPGSQPPSLHHHHSMTTPVASHVSQSPHSIAPHPGSRPSLDRAHTFPTPPTSASSTVGMNSQGQYDSWGQNMGAGVQSAQPLAIDTHAHSTPNTPATTPPGPPMSSLQNYQGQQPYDSSRPMYSSATTQQAQYAPQQTVPPQGMARLSGPIQANPYLKQHEMGPPSARAPGAGPDIEHGDHKAEGYPHGQGNDTVGHGTGEEEAEHEHDSEYPHENNAAYNANRGTYNNYSCGPNLGALPGEHPHMSPEMSGSPPHQNGSGRVTPRTSAGSQPQWAAGYHTPPRASAPSNQYPSISDARATVSNGTAGTEAYPGSLPASYAPLHVNGAPSSNKRMREDEDQDHQSRPASRGDDIDSLKRRKLAREGSVSGPIGGTNSFERDARPINRARAPIPPQTPQQQQQQQRRGR